MSAVMFMCSRGLQSVALHQTLLASGNLAVQQDPHYHNTQQPLSFMTLLQLSHMAVGQLSPCCKVCCTLRNWLVAMVMSLMLSLSMTCAHCRDKIMTNM